VLPLARALAVVVLALALVSAAGAKPERSVARFCGSTDGAQWVAKRQDPGAPFAGTLFGDSYRVWRRSVDCDWAFHKVAFLTHGLGTKYMNLANLGDFKCRTRRPPAREHILSLNRVRPAANAGTPDRSPSPDLNGDRRSRLRSRSSLHLTAGFEPATSGS
jgi:hypothetical protein